MSVEMLTICVASKRHGPRFWTRVRIAPHIRKDGAETSVAVWRGRCVVCGGEFEILTPANVTACADSGNGSFALVTCHKHRGQAVAPAKKSNPDCGSVQRYGCGVA